MIGKWHVYSRLPAVGVDWDMAIYWHKKMINAYYYDQKVSINGAEPVELNGYSVDRHTDYAVDYIKQRADGGSTMVSVALLLQPTLSTNTRQTPRGRRTAM